VVWKDALGRDLNKGDFANGNGTVNYYDADGNFLQSIVFKDGVGETPIAPGN
jgi:hypothetical protein